MTTAADKDRASSAPTHGSRLPPTGAGRLRSYGDDDSAGFAMSDASKAAFLSYASQDSDAAKKICDALRAAGVEVWLDQSELVGGDAWDRRIRDQIANCALFLPVISANTQVRLEGYFRIEWKLAGKRTHAMAAAKAFLIPVVIDDTRDTEAHVPDEFRDVQWTRLDGGETTPAFCARVQKLLESRTGSLAAWPAGSASSETGPGRTRRPSGRRWLAPALAAGVLAVAGIGAWLAVRLSSTPHPSGPDVPATVPAVSAARQLVVRAQPLIAAASKRRTDLDTAASLLAQAEKADPNDASVWAAWALLDGAYLESNLDHSPARKAAAQEHAAQALSLAPRSREARLAQASVIVPIHDYDRAAFAEAEKILRELVEEDPRDSAALIRLAYAVYARGAAPDALALFDRARALPGSAAEAEFGRMQVHYYSGRYAEAEKAIDAALAIERTPMALTWKMLLTLIWRGDLEEAARLEAELSPSWRLESIGAAISTLVSTWRREPDRGLAVLRTMPSDYIRCSFYAGPKALLAGDLLAMDARAEAAQVEWNRALQMVERELSASPNDESSLITKVLLLDRLGRKVEAEKLYRVTRELFGEDFAHAGRRAVMLWMEPPDRSVELLEKLMREHSFDWQVPTAAMLRYDPLYDRARQSSRFAALLARAQADPRLTPVVIAAGDSQSAAATRKSGDDDKPDEARKQ